MLVDMPSITALTDSAMMFELAKSDVDYLHLLW